MIELALACLATLVFVGLKSFQQRNVAFDHYKWIIPTSIGMAFTEFFVIVYVVSAGYHWPAILALGACAGLGSLSATLLHGRLLGGVNGKKTGGVSSGMLAQGITEVRSRGHQGKEGTEGAADAHTRLAQEVQRAQSGGGPK
jgi:hypothetical protein